MLAPPPPYRSEIQRNTALCYAAPRRNRVNLGVLAAGTLALAISSDGTHALDLKSDVGERDGTIAYAQAVKNWDTAKRYGAESVHSRDRTWAKQNGIRIGNYLILSGFETRYVFDDNVFNTANNRESDHTLQLLPTLKLRSMFPRHVLDFEFGGKISRFARHKELDHADVFGTMDGALHINNAHTLSLSLLSALETEDTLISGALQSAAEKTQIWRNRAKLGLTRDAGRTYAKIGASYESWDFRDVRAKNGTTIDQDVRDLRIFSSDVKLGYRFSPGFSVETRLRGLRRLHRGDAILSTDAWGYEIIAGLKIQSNPLLKWDFMAGIGRRDYDQTGLQNTDVALLKAGITWLARPNLTIYGAIKRNFDEGVTTDAILGKVDTSAELTAEFEASRNLIFTIKGKYVDSEFIGSARKDQLAIANFQILYLTSKNWKLTFDYEFAYRKSNVSKYDLKRNRFMVGVKRQF